MTIPVCEVSIAESALELPERTSDPAAGAVVDFLGIVRAREDEREIAGIEYEAHREMAEHQMRAVVENAARDFDVKCIRIRHRIGFVPATEASILVHVESGHRTAAFSASEWIMDEVKRNVPIWKRPIFKNSSALA